MPVPCPEDDSQDSEAPEWCLEEQVDGSYLIVPCPEDQLMIPMIPEIHFFTLAQHLKEKMMVKTCRYVS